jgi:hypothetical protein
MSKLLVKKPEGTRPTERPRCKGVVILTCILDTSDGMVWTGLIWLRIRTTGRLF